MKETRVGYVTIDILLKMTEDYIKAFTNNGKYEGDAHYLLCYNGMRKYMDAKE